jgi:hypothetical protein
MADWHTIELIKMRKLISIFSIFAIALYSCASMLINPFVFSYFLNKYPAANAYTIAKLSSSRDDIILVRRSGDDAEAYFSASELTSTAEQWVIDGGGTQRGYVVEWLDGEGNNNLSQSTAANQPLLIDNGALREDGLLFDSTDFLLGESGWDIGLNDATIAGQMFVADGTPSANTMIFISHSLGLNSFELIGQTGGNIRLVWLDSGGYTVHSFALSQTLPDATLVNFVLTLDRAEDATFTWKEVGGSATGTGSIDISSTASIDIGAGNSNSATVGNDTDFANSGVKALFVWHELLSAQAQTALLNLE